MKLYFYHLNLNEDCDFWEELKRNINKIIEIDPDYDKFLINNKKIFANFYWMELLDLNISNFIQDNKQFMKYVNESNKDNVYEFINWCISSKKLPKDWENYLAVKKINKYILKNIDNCEILY